MDRTFLRAPILMLVAALVAAPPAYGGGGDADPLAREVNYRLTRAEVVEQGVLVVHAEGGRVELMGRVRSRDLVDEAGRIAAEVEGVDEVVNRLKVADTPSGGGGSGSNRHLPQGKAAEPVDNEQGQQQPSGGNQSDGQQAGQQSDQQQPSQQKQQTSGQQQGGGKQPQQPSGQSQPSGQQQSGSGRQ